MHSTGQRTVWLSREDLPAKCTTEDYNNSVIRTQDWDYRCGTFHRNFDAVSYTHLDVYKRQGFGRIGRLAFRQMFDAEGYEVVAINDLTSPKMLAHLLKYDTAQGSFCGKIGEAKHTVEATEDSIIVDGKEIKIYAVKDAKDAPWGELNVDVVLECTGFYTSKEKSMAHIQAGAKKVVISAPAGNDLKTIVYSVNEKTLTAEDQVISAASCTTNCLAPMANTLNKTYPIVSGITVSYTHLDVYKRQDGVLICRPFVTAVYGGGEEGVKCYIDKLAGELADTMQMCGAHSLAEITPDMVRV